MRSHALSCSTADASHLIGQRDGLSDTFKQRDRLGSLPVSAGTLNYPLA